MTDVWGREAYMVSDVDKTLLNCQHSHLFQSPLCNSQSLLQKIVNIIFHILTLGIPFFFYHIINYFLNISCCLTLKRMCCPLFKTSISTQVGGVLSEDIVKAIYNSFPEGLKAFQAVVEKMEGFKESYDWAVERRPNTGAVIYLPVDERISSYIAFYDLSVRKFHELLERYGLEDGLGCLLRVCDQDNTLEEDTPLDSPKQHNPWNIPEVLNAANQLMEIGYVLSILTLQDIPLFRKQLADDEDDYVPLRELIFYPVFYTAHTLNCCWEAYTWIRMGLVYDKQRNGLCFIDSTYRQDRGCVGMANIVGASLERFQKHKDLNGYMIYWNALYNDYSQRLANYSAKIATLDTRFLPVSDDIVKDKLICKKEISKDNEKEEPVYKTRSDFIRHWI